MQKAAGIIGVLASLAAVIAVVLTGWQLHHDLQAQQIQQWEDVAVYSICLDAGNHGASLNDIESKYLEAARNLPVALPREAQQTNAIKRTLLSLINGNAVWMLPDGSYAPTMAQGVPDIGVLAAKSQKIIDRLVALVGSHPGSFSEAQLESQMLQEFPSFSKGQLDALFNQISLGEPRILAYDSKGKAILTSVK